MSEFVRVADALEMLPGARKLCKVGGRQIILFNVAGKLYAVDNRCPRDDGPLGAGKLDDVELACPRDGWRYNLATGDCLDATGHRLTRHEIVLEGEDVLVRVESSASEAGPIYTYLVRYGIPGYVGRFGSIRPVLCARGDQVVVATDRGLEVGELLVAQDNSHERGPAGELLRRLTEEDRRQQARGTSLARAVAEQARGAILERRLPVEVVESEGLLDGETVILYYLGQGTTRLGPLAVELGMAEETARIEFRPLVE